MTAIGLTLFCPLYLGVLRGPLRTSRHCRRCWLPGATPRPPTRPAARSLRYIPIQIRHHEHVIQFGFLNQSHAHVVHQHFIVLNVGKIFWQRSRATGIKETVGVLHNVRFGHRCHLFAIVLDGIIKRKLDDTFCALAPKSV